VVFYLKKKSVLALRGGMQPSMIGKAMQAAEVKPLRTWRRCMEDDQYYLIDKIDCYGNNNSLD
jgi:hypothetical protein|tara:strand:- start:2706 stop:2894 length:189 start_codon:yes stop_codon:yes gene_type:complete